MGLIMESSFRLPKGFSYHLLYVLIMPVFFICFCSIYDPFSVKEFYQVGGKSFFFHFLMLSCIILGVLAITRLILSALVRLVSFLRWHYLLWCFGEVVVITFFTALYTTLFFGEELPYFMALPQCFQYNAMILFYPYLFLVLEGEIEGRNALLRSKESGGDPTLVKFYDDHSRLKLSIDPSAVLYISAEANYVKIHYLENDKVREFLLRNSMKSLDAIAAKHGFVRCHRSYYVNPKHIKVLGRNKEGIIIAEMLEDGVRQIPVSKQYYASLSELL